MDMIGQLHGLSTTGEVATDIIKFVGCVATDTGMSVGCVFTAECPDAVQRSRNLFCWK
jgi:hypothetical protein